MNKISILGTEFKIQLTPNDVDFWGEVNHQNNTISLTKDKYEKNETIAHELLHAYFYRCGLDNYAKDEILHHAFGRFFEEFLQNYKRLQKMLPKLKK